MNASQNQPFNWREFERRRKERDDKIEAEFREIIVKLRQMFDAAERERIKSLPVEMWPTVEEIKKMTDTEWRSHNARARQRMKNMALVRRNDPPDIPGRSGGYQTTVMP